MTPFVGTHTNKLDAKGRVSIPALFRSVLKSGEGGTPLILRRSHQHACIEGWHPDTFATLATQLDQFAMFSEDEDALAAALFSDAWPVEADKEGRIVLPEALVDHAGLKDAVVFLGVGRTFQIWEPDAAKRRQAEARELVRSRGLTLSSAAAGAAK